MIKYKVLTEKQIIGKDFSFLQEQFGTKQVANLRWDLPHKNGQKNLDKMVFVILCMKVFSTLSSVGFFQVEKEEC